MYDSYYNLKIDIQFYYLSHKNKLPYLVLKKIKHKFIKRYYQKFSNINIILQEAYTMKFLIFLNIFFSFICFSYDTSSEQKIELKKNDVLSTDCFPKIDFNPSFDYKINYNNNSKNFSIKKQRNNFMDFLFDNRTKLSNDKNIDNKTN